MDGVKFFNELKKDAMEDLEKFLETLTDQELLFAIEFHEKYPRVKTTVILDSIATVRERSQIKPLDERLYG
jgi:succinate dehydrogenase flavin-adding protein (antitoxin of CptAB toxin-antitoxin module)